jgi:hypothetical protein
MKPSTNSTSCSSSSRRPPTSPTKSDDINNPLEQYLRTNHGLYHPSIYRYSCYGVFKIQHPPPPPPPVSSSKPFWVVSSWFSRFSNPTPSTNTTTTYGNAGRTTILPSQDHTPARPSFESSPQGTCYGIQSKLAHWMDLEQPPSPRDLDLSHSLFSPLYTPQTSLVGMTDKTTFSSYGTTRIHLLTVRPQPNQPDVVIGLACHTPNGFRTQTTTMEGNLETRSLTVLSLGPLHFKLEAYDKGVTPTKGAKRPTLEREQTITPIEHGKLLFKHSKRILEAMKSNYKICVEAVREDFPSRWWSASLRIVNQFDKTANRAVDLAKTVYDFWTRDDDDDDNDDDDGMF